MWVFGAQLWYWSVIWKLMIRSFRKNQKKWLPSQCFSGHFQHTTSGVSVELPWLWISPKTETENHQTRSVTFQGEKKFTSKKTPELNPWITCRWGSRCFAERSRLWCRGCESSQHERSPLTPHCCLLLICLINSKQQQPRNITFEGCVTLL